jgi:hypothetical protein
MPNRPLLPRGAISKFESHSPDGRMGKGALLSLSKGARRAPPPYPCPPPYPPYPCPPSLP